MKCQYCSNSATVHLTDIINKKKREVHLCEDCARQKNLIPEPEQELNIQALLHFVMNEHQSVAPPKEAGPDLVCPECGTNYPQFRAQGRLGCPHDYEVFRSLLEPLLERIHRSTQHHGKVPARLLERSKNRVRRRELELELRAAITQENYEAAAQLRDQIRAMGVRDES